MAWFLRHKKKKRVLVLGLDCADPSLVFDQFHGDLPVLNGLAGQGTYGKLESSIPCITVPAWASMLSGHDPGELGVYGFRNRQDYSYSQMITADSRSIRVKRVWDYATEAGLDSIVIGVPQTYPVKPLQGHLVSSFLTPGIESAFTYPAVFKQEVLSVTPDYHFDVKDFRTEDKQCLLQRIYDMTEVQLKLLKHCLQTKPWDFAMYVNIGTDRIHHGFWRYHDPNHRLYEPGNPYQNAIRDYYKMLDEQIGDILETLDDVTVLVVSDHGVKRMDGGICVNEWLWRNGWLSLNTVPETGKITAFEKLDVDWSRTRAWASGGYYGRIFMNIESREAQGMIPPAAYESVRTELAEALQSIPGPDGQALQTIAYRPQEIYKAVNNVAPDLLVYFGDLHWRSVGSLGHGQHYTLENDTGPDDANHGQYGMFILYDPAQRGKGYVEGHQLQAIAPTLLQKLGIRLPEGWKGKGII
ncbi:MAG: alkaline phosphatase family protein [Anaerolineae bacterium]|nr:alkaline phosphatase family protein [Anaerolineae bacterium]